MTAPRDKFGRPIVVVTGMGVVTSLGAGKADNWAKLTAGESGIRTVTRFAINAHDLLLVRDDARLDARVARGVCHQSGAADFLFLQQFLQLLGGVITANRAEKFRRNI